MTEYPIYSAGKFLKTGQQLQIKNPWNDQPFALTWKAGNQELENAIAGALSIKDQLAKLPAYKRYEVLMDIATEITSHKEEFTRILSLESAKPWRYAKGEVERAIQTFTIAAEESKRLPGDYISIDWTPAGEGKEGIVRYFPVGLIAGISPFNFPLNLAVHKIAPAIASGCPIILKPSTSTPLSTLKLAEIIDQTEIPKGAVSILPMDRETGNQLVTDERFNLLTFTGSPEVGWKMKKDAGKKKVVLELGGNAAVVVTKSADLNSAVKKCVIGGFAYSGQVCIHAQRIYVHKEIYGAFSEKFIEATKHLKIGDPADPETEISAMIDEENAIRVENWVNEAVQGGAKILSGGKRNKTFFEPTVLSETNNQMKVCSLEVFGPVVTLEPFDNFESVINLVNDSRYGLQAGVFTNEISEMNYAFENLHVGGVIINDVPTFRVDHIPYGGVKDSGLGREGVKYAILDMMEPKILVKPR
ncbi:MAG TPA: aldehyde dehydrogenase family protein [Bacteroidales bacterium]|nr:aldehyde dehydrogenase family protein [Bacteroidales bacterium]HRX97423.1 aldehyde dehydrogenase family protein [Bacteroidales bacterium]